MKKIILPAVIMCISCIVSAQYNDLVVTTEGDSIACKILENNDSEIIFNMKFDGHKNLNTKITNDKIVEFKYDVIEDGMYFYRPKTSYIEGKIYPISSDTYSLTYLQNASADELNFYLYKAQRLQKTGKTFNIVGVSTFGVSMICLFATSDAWGMGALIFSYPAMAGLGVLALGIPVNLTGKKRAERINTVKNTTYNNIKFQLQPTAQYNPITKNYHPGVSLLVRF